MWLSLQTVANQVGITRGLPGLGITICPAPVCPIRFKPPSLTCSVDVEVSGFVGHVSHGLQAWSTSRHLAGVPKRHPHIDFEGAPVNILPRKEDSDLGVGETGWGGGKSGEIGQASKHRETDLDFPGCKVVSQKKENHIYKSPSGLRASWSLPHRGR